eukprot:gnl/Spiro4/7205_TR3756_c0_g1_i1.p1 gnl/Spiro4/7205_TR3756_c0_g1~~gnl/Spiro4/7205_TR3756_c0_g1_i1.p1  ORF type:complete len:274 (-),score=13.76 gnl/Spiro4/7205_TR3756_c0_g1_i1:310-1044(-)
MTPTGQDSTTPAPPDTGRAKRSRTVTQHFSPPPSQKRRRVTKAAPKTTISKPGRPRKSACQASSQQPKVFKPKTSIKRRRMVRQLVVQRDLGHADDIFEPASNVQYQREATYGIESDDGGSQISSSPDLCYQVLRPPQRFNDNVTYHLQQRGVLIAPTHFVSRPHQPTQSAAPAVYTLPNVHVDIHHSDSEDEENRLLDQQESIHSESESDGDPQLVDAEEDEDLVAIRSHARPSENVLLLPSL